MFRRIRLELARDYTRMMIGFMLLVACLGIAVFIGSVYVQQKDQVALLALEETEEYWYILKYGAAIEHKKEIEESSTTKKIFYRAFDASGKEVGSHRAWQAAIDTHASALIKSGELEDDEIVFHVSGMPGKADFTAYMMMKKTVYDGEEAIGTVYAGRDVRSFVKFIGTVLILMTVILAVLSWTAYRLARRMADKAMIPIEIMYGRQKEFTADASHELRTPLSIFLSSVETIEMDKESRLSPFSRDVLHDLKDETKKMRRLIENLLTLARNEQTALKKIDQTLFVLHELVLAEVEKWQGLAEKKGIVLDYLPASECAVLANRGHLCQIIGILLDNACKYTFPGNKVQVSLTDDGKRAVLTVSDEGCGIEEEYQELIFERFFRVDKMRSRQVEGTGLGLSIAKCLIEINGGKITLDSKIGEGSTFKVSLPVRQEPNEEK